MAVRKYVFIVLGAPRTPSEPLPGPGIDPQGPATRSPSHPEQFPDRHKIEERRLKVQKHPQTSSPYGAGPARVRCLFSVAQMGVVVCTAKVMVVRVWYKHIWKGSFDPDHSRRLDEHNDDKTMRVTCRRGRGADGLGNWFHRKLCYFWLCSRASGRDIADI